MARKQTPKRMAPRPRSKKHARGQLKEIVCPNPKCGYVNHPRKPNPKQCPFCKRYYAEFTGERQRRF